MPEAAMQRPPKPDYAPEFVAAVEDPDWRVAHGEKCSFIRCEGTAVVALNRRSYRYKTQRHYDRWMNYCADHTYGRWVEDGQVWHWNPIWPEDGSTS